MVWSQFYWRAGFGNQKSLSMLIVTARALYSRSLFSAAFKEKHIYI